MLLSTKGQITVPAELRARHRLHGIDGVLTIVRAENAVDVLALCARREP